MTIIRYNASRITHHASRITHHASRITHHASRKTASLSGCNSEIIICSILSKDQIKFKPIYVSIV